MAEGVASGSSEIEVPLGRQSVRRKRGHGRVGSGPDIDRGRGVGAAIAEDVIGSAEGEGTGGLRSARGRLVMVNGSPRAIHSLERCRNGVYVPR